MERECTTQKLVIGNAVFRNSTDLKTFESKKVISILGQNRWDINYKKYQKYKLSNIFLNMLQSTAQRIWLGSNQNSKIVKQIQNVVYVNLIQLSLYKNNIDNIQPISFMNFQRLKHISLGNNYITQLKSLKKLNLPDLDQLYLHKNHLIDYTHFNQSKINCQIFKELVFQFFSQEIPTNIDLSLLTKLCCQQVQVLQIKSKTRIKQPRIQIILKMRFPSISIRQHD